MDKPILFLDVDGVLFGKYDIPSICGKVFQLRLGINSFLCWAVQHFDVQMLTGWPEKEVFELFSLLYVHPEVRAQIKYCAWADNKSEAFKGTNGNFYWLDDDLLDEDEKCLKDNGWSDRYIPVNYHGAFSLDRAVFYLIKKAGIK